MVFKRQVLLKKKNNISHSFHLFLENPEEEDVDMEESEDTLPKDVLSLPE